MVDWLYQRYMKASGQKQNTTLVRAKVEPNSRRQRFCAIVENRQEIVLGFNRQWH